MKSFEDTGGHWTRDRQPSRGRGKKAASDFKDVPSRDRKRVLQNGPADRHQVQRQWARSDRPPSGAGAVRPVGSRRVGRGEAKATPMSVAAEF